jgi:hypothetical protein
LRIAPSLTIALPLVALLAAAISTIALAAHAGLAFCDNRVVVPMPDTMASMPGMDMGSPGALMICPVVLVLIVASTLLAVAAIAVVWRDPHRGLARRTIVRALAALPLGRTAGVLMLGGGAAVALMLLLDGSGPPALTACPLLAALLAGCSLLAATFSIVIGRITLAFGRRLLLAVVAAISAATAPAPPCARRRFSLVAGGRALPLLAAGRGLRAPPSFVH